MSDDSPKNQTPKRGRSKQAPGMTDEQKAILAQVPDLYNDPRSLVEIWADGFKQRSEQMEMQQQQQHVQQQQYIQQQQHQPSAQQSPFFSPSRPRPHAAAPVFTALGAATTPGQQGGEDPFVQRNSPAAAAAAAAAGARNPTGYSQGYHHHKRGSSSSSLGTNQWPAVASPLSERVTPPSRASYAPPAQFGASPSPALHRVSFARIEEEEARQMEQRREKKKGDGQGWH